MILGEAGTDPQLFQYLGVLFLALVAVGFAVGTMFASKLAGWVFSTRKAKALGRHTPTKDTPYECGMLPVGDGTSRLSVKFYLVAMLFILFDIEVVFLYPWAVSFRTFLEAGGGAALASISVIGVFIAILAVGLLYDVKKGGLDWD